MHRPSWDELYLIEALYISSRSHDEQTQCGCVLVDKDKTIIGHGYNGFIRDIDDKILPRTRPDKYPFMIHAEHNAILNSCRQGKSTKEAAAYITGKPCLNCLQYMWQAGISQIIYSDFSKPNMIDNDGYENNFKLLLSLMHRRIIIKYIPSVDLKYDHIKETLGKIEKSR